MVLRRILEEEMMSKCDLDDCSLTGGIQEIKDNQKTMMNNHSEMIKTHAVFVEKVDGYMKRGKEDHKVLFDKVRGVMKWSHFAMAVGSIGTIIFIIFGAIRLSGNG